MIEVRKLSIWLACIALVAATVGINAAALGAPAKPRIKKGVMMDRDGNYIADAIVLTYSKKIKHQKDTDGKYPFSVQGYKIASIGKAQGRLLIINLVEDPLAPAAPTVRYKPTKKGPVTAAKGKKKQAKKQTFKNVAPMPPMPPLNQVTVIVEGSGSVASVPKGIQCPAQCEGGFPEGSLVSLMAVPSFPPGATFERWEGDCTGTVPTCQLSMDGSSKVVTAVFSN